MIFQNTVIPVDQWGSNLKIIFLGDFFGHPDMVVINERTGRKTVYNNAGTLGIEDPVFHYPCLTIPVIAFDEYKLYSMNQETGDMSYGIDVSIIGDNKSILMTKAMRMADLSDKAIIQSLCNEADNDTDCILFLLERYRAASEKEKTDIAIFLKSLLSMYNARIQSLELTPQKFCTDIDTSVIRISNETGQVLRFHADGNAPACVRPGIGETECRMPVIYDTISLYVETDRQGIPLNMFLDFQPSGETGVEIKNARAAYVENYEKAIQKQSIYVSQYLELEEQEQEWMPLIDKLNSPSPLLCAPEIQWNGKEIEIQFDAGQSAFADTFLDGLHIAFIEPELCLERTGLRRIYTDWSDTELRAIEYDIFDEPYFYWVEDSNGTCLSDIKVLSGHSNTNERLRRISLEKYEQHLIPYADNKYDDVSTIIVQALKSAETDPYCFAPVFYRKMIENAVLMNSSRMLSSVIRCVMEDRLLYGRYAMEFFSSRIFVKNYGRTILMPSCNEVLYVFESYSRKDGWSAAYIPSSGIAATEYTFQNTDFGVAWAIDRKSYTLSGFVLLDFTKSATSARIYKFLINDVEVVQQHG